jgi:hypothetical protein
MAENKYDNTITKEIVRSIVEGKKMWKNTLKGNVVYI